MPRDRNEYNHQYYQQNRERILAHVKEYYQKNRERKKAYFEAYLSKPENVEKRNKYIRVYVRSPKFKKADKKRKREKNEWYRKYHLEYYHKNKERINAKRRKINYERRSHVADISPR